MKALHASVVALLLICAAIVLRADLGFDAPVLAASERLAPEWQVSESWINSNPLRLADLRGKVVLVDFWTYSCINCLRTIPYLNEWYEQYKDRGLVIVGIHTPEFGFEGERVNVDDAVKRLGITFPVAQDNDFATWKRYDNYAWPGFYLIDQQGKIVFTRYGEGEYDRTENRIRKLLGIDGRVAQDDGTDLSRVQTPEMYFGTEHESHQSANQKPAAGSKVYEIPGALRSIEFALGGTWSRTAERASLVSDNGTITLRFNAAKVHIVAGSPASTELIVRVDGGTPRRVPVGRPQLYTLYDSTEYREHTLQIEVPMRGFDAYSFTFG